MGGKVSVLLSFWDKVEQAKQNWFHIEKSVEKLRERYGVKAQLDLPKIPYRETIKKPAQAVIYRHKKKTDGGPGGSLQRSISMSFRFPGVRVLNLWRLSRG